MDTSDELRENAEKAREPFDKKVAVSMAVIAAALAIVSVFGHILTTEELLNQQKSSDRWSFYQAKSIRRYESEIARDLLVGAPAAAERAQKYGANVERYQRESDEIQQQAKELEETSEHKGRQAVRLHMGEIFLEIAIVFASLAILTKRTYIWGIGLSSGALGVAIGCTTLLVH